MKIHRVNVELDKLQNILPSEDLNFNILDFNGSAKSESWKLLKFYVFNPIRTRKNFFLVQSNGGVIAMDEKAVYELSSFWLSAGELLPIELEESGEKLFIFNVTEVSNSLDVSKTEFDYYSDGSRGRILKHCFKNNRFPESSIFKIPETVKTHILAYSGVKDSEDEFYYAYKKSGLKGLSFEELYQTPPLHL